MLIEYLNKKNYAIKPSTSFRMEGFHMREEETIEFPMDEVRTCGFYLFFRGKR